MQNKIVFFFNNHIFFACRHLSAQEYFSLIKYTSREYLSLQNYRLLFIFYRYSITKVDIFFVLPNVLCIFFSHRPPVKAAKRDNILPR